MMDTLPFGACGFAGEVDIKVTNKMVIWGNFLVNSVTNLKCEFLFSALCYRVVVKAVRFTSARNFDSLGKGRCRFFRVRRRLQRKRVELHRVRPFVRVYRIARSF